MKNRYLIPAFLVAGILAIFVARTLLAESFHIPRTFHLFDTLTIIGALLVLVKHYRNLQMGDWIISIALGLAIGVGAKFATLFSPYPFLGLVRNDLAQAMLRGLFTAIATLGGLAIMRQGGPVQFYTANGNWRNMGRGVLAGLVVGLPLAVLNIFAMQATQGQSIHWQNPFAALLDAFQPGVVEEVIYRFALWGLFWLILRGSIPNKAVWLAGFLAALVHGYSHFDDFFLQAPLMGLGMGALLTALWGLPALVLARRRGLESAIAFHWLQDALRFWTGF